MSQAWRKGRKVREIMLNHGLAAYRALPTTLFVISTYFEDRKPLRTPIVQAGRRGQDGDEENATNKSRSIEGTSYVI